MIKVITQVRTQVRTHTYWKTNKEYKKWKPNKGVDGMITRTHIHFIN